MSFTSNDNTYSPVGINKDNLFVLDTSTSTDNISLHSSNNDSIDIINIKTLLNKDSNKELHLSAFDGSTINPIIKINNTHQHVNIISNLNISHNLNIDNLTITHNSISTNVNSYKIAFLNNTLTDIGLVKTNNVEINNTIIKNGSINNTVIGNLNPSTGNFTTLKVNDSLLATGNIGIGTQNPQAKLDVNGDIQFKSNNEFNNISDFFPGYYKSINSGTNIGLPLDFEPEGSDNLEGLKTVKYNDMKVSITNKTIYTNKAIFGQDATFNSAGKNGYYFQLTGTGIKVWNDTNESYIDTDLVVDSLGVRRDEESNRAWGDSGSVFIELEDKNQNPIAVYRNKFTEISFDIAFTSFTTGETLHVYISTATGDDLFNIYMKSYVHYQYIDFNHKGMDLVGSWERLVSTEKLLFNKRTDGREGIFFNIKIAFNDDEWAVYFDNKLLKTDLDQVISGYTADHIAIVTTGTKNVDIKRTLSPTFKDFINDSNYNKLGITYQCGDSYANCYIKNIQIKSGFGCHICT